MCKLTNLGPLGKLYPSVNGKWVEKEEDLSLSDLTPKANYRPSEEISEAIKGASLGWATAKDDDKEGTEQEPENGDTPDPETPDPNAGGGDNGGGDNGGGNNDLEG